MPTTRVGLGGPVGAYLGFVAKPLSPSCLVPSYREIVFDQNTGLVAAGFLMQVFLYDGSGRPAANPDSASVIFQSTQPWATTHAAMVAAVIARALEFGIELSPTNVIMHLPEITRN